MAWTYSGNPAASEKDAVRFLAQDTDAQHQRVTDEEIVWLLTQEANVYMAAAAIIDILVKRFVSSGLAGAGVMGGGSVSIGDFSISMPSVMEYEKLSVELRARGRTYIGLYAGGISEADKDFLPSDSDWPSRYFKLGLHQDHGGDGPLD